MKKIIVLVLVLVSSFCVFSQKVFKANDINVISIDTTNNETHFFKKITKNLYKYINYEESKKNILEFRVKDDDYTQKEIFEDFDLTFFIDDIKPTNPKKYLQNKWLIELKDEVEEDKYKLITAINPYIFAVHNIYFGKSRGSRGVGSSTTKLPDDDTEKWRSDYGNFYQIAIVKLKNDRYIYTFFDENNYLEGFLIPTPRKDYFYYANNDFTTLKPVEKEYNINFNESLERFRADEFYTLQKKKSGYQLQTVFKTPVIRKKYDTILYSNMYVIGRRKHKIDVYNYRLKPIKIPYLKSAYFKGSYWLEVLVKNDAKYINEYAKTVQKFPYQYTTVCGTVPSLNADINKSNKDKSYYLEYSIANFAEKADIKRIKFKNILQTDSITFLDKSKEFYVDGNKVSMITQELLFEQLYRVKRSGKIGLFQLKDSVKFTKEPFKRKVEDFFFKPKEILVHQTTVKLTQLLPFDFDKVEYRNRLIYIEKGNKKGYLYNLTPMLFDEFEKVTDSFFKIKKNGKKGFIDVVTGKEYY